MTAGVECLSAGGAGARQAADSARRDGPGSSLRHSDPLYLLAAWPSGGTGAHLAGLLRSPTQWRVRAAAGGLVTNELVGFSLVIMVITFDAFLQNPLGN